MPNPEAKMDSRIKPLVGRALPYIVFGRPSIGSDEIEAVTACLRSGWVGTGPKVQEFEERFGSYVGAKNAVAVGSCTAALHLSLLALGIEPGDEVITTPFTFAATVNVILHVGATPIFVDVDRETMNIDVAQIESRITGRTKAILPVHFAGRPCHMDMIQSLAEKHGLWVIEDAAHAIEARYRGRKIGTISPVTCFSFYVTKNITTVEGGMVCTEDDHLAAKIRVAALHGLSADAWARFSDDGYKHYEVVCPGFKYNMTDVQAAIGLCQLKRIDNWLRRRQEIWQQYDEGLSGLPCQVPVPVEEGTVHARHLYTVLLDLDQLRLTRDQVMLALHERGIGTGVHYRSVHLHKYYQDRFGFEAADFPNATWISDRTISIPLAGELLDEDVARIVRSLREVLQDCT